MCFPHPSTLHSILVDPSVAAVEARGIIIAHGGSGPSVNTRAAMHTMLHVIPRPALLSALAYLAVELVDIVGTRCVGGAFGEVRGLRF